ncbi:MAG: hypothetical protein ABIQ39_06020, partial [Ilumatobacteraceae bacterium]
KDTSVSMLMHIERPASGGWFSSWQPSTPWLRFTGPGRVAVSSQYEAMERTGRIVRTSDCTSVDWNNQRGAMQVSSLQSAMAASYDDRPLEAALDAFAATQGFAAGRDKNRGVSKSHEYNHPSGIDVTCTVVDTAAATAALSNIAGVLGSRGSMLTGKLNSVIGNMASRGAGGGEPVDGLACRRRGNQTTQTPHR